MGYALHTPKIIFPTMWEHNASTDFKAAMSRMVRKAQMGPGKAHHNCVAHPFLWRPLALFGVRK